jgi:hypothetical protein
MDEISDYIQRYKVRGMVLLVVILVVLGIFSSHKSDGPVPFGPYNRFCMRPGGCINSGVWGPQRGYGMQPQQVAFQSNGLTLSIGVTLEGRGDVVSVEPGSAAQRAGIQVGDRINRINGS